MSYRLSVVRVFALNWERSADFYQNQMELPLRFRDADAGWAEFDLGGPILAVERVQPEEADEESLTGRFLGISLEVTDIQASCNRLLEHGVVFNSLPARQPWGGVLAHFEDPEGNVLTLLQRPGN